MSTKSNVVLGKEATEGLLAGIKQATQAIRLSYGPKGLNAALEHESEPFHMVANDCETIIQAIHVEDKVQKIGLDFLKELSKKVHQDSGDGRKTTCIIAEEIIQQCYEQNLSGLELKRELDNLIPIIEHEINKQKKEIAAEEVEAVARIAGESEQLGILLGTIYKAIGRDGIIIPESSGTFSNSFSIIEGVRFTGAGFLSPYFAHDETTDKPTKAVYEKPLILVTKRKIEKDSDIESLLDNCISTNKPLVIFCDDMDSGVASRMIATHRAKVAKILIIRAPVLWKNYIFEDFAKVTGATIVEDASGLTFKNLQLEHLGTCDRIIVDKEETTITGGADITDHIADLKTQGDNDSKLRLSWLTTKTAILKLGANNESELSYLRLKCYDAINSCRLALKDGVVEGGGLCLARIAAELPISEVGMILSLALLSPYNQNRHNMGFPQLPLDPIGNPILLPVFEEEVLDAAAVVKNAVRNAIALASTVLTTGIVITLPKKSSEQIAQEALSQKGLRF